ncbi:MAG: cytochrome c [Myxococcota bacterium]|nr:cytochrome c [Myxococcota bacterium]
MEHIQRLRPLWAALLVSPLLLSCEAQSGDTPPSPADRGKAIYLNVCIACHNANPALDGSVGPAIAGSSEALLEAKVLHGTYPPGYKPKRPGSGAMPRFPHLADQIPALAAYLDSVPQKP